LKKSTLLASRFGQIFAWFMILSGSAMIFGLNIPLLGGGLLSGIWIAFIGWFLNNAAVQSYEYVLVKEKLSDIPVSEFMREDIEPVDPHVSVEKFVHRHVIGSDMQEFPVALDGKLLGIVSIEDIKRLETDKWRKTAVKQIMSPKSEIVTATPYERTADAISKLMQLGMNYLPVVENGKLVGLLNRKDVLFWLNLRTIYN
jgi:CBS domain-containing protein